MAAFLAGPAAAAGAALLAPRVIQTAAAIPGDFLSTLRAAMGASANPTPATPVANKAAVPQPLASGASLRDSIASALSELHERIRNRLAQAGIVGDEPFELSLNGAGELRVQDHPLAADVERTLTADEQIRTGLEKLARLVAQRNPSEANLSALASPVSSRGPLPAGSDLACPPLELRFTERSLKLDSY